jgi:acetoin utilization protein AcuB
MIVSDVMNPNPTTIRFDTSLSAAIETLRVLDVRQLPVVNDNKEVVGILSDRDLQYYYEKAGEPQSAVSPRQYHHLEAPVSYHMSTNEISIGGKASLRDLVDLMVEHSIETVPVVDDSGRLQGSVSYVDLLRELQKLLPRGE